MTHGIDAAGSSDQSGKKCHLNLANLENYVRADVAKKLREFFQTKDAADATVDLSDFDTDGDLSSMSTSDWKALGLDLKRSDMKELNNALLQSEVEKFEDGTFAEKFYDSDGNLVKKTTADGSVHEYEYSASDSPELTKETITKADGTVITQERYDGTEDIKEWVGLSDTTARAMLPHCIHTEKLKTGCKEVTKSTDGSTTICIYNGKGSLVNKVIKKADGSTEEYQNIKGTMFPLKFTGQDGTVLEEHNYSCFYTGTMGKYGGEIRQTRRDAVLQDIVKYPDGSEETLAYNEKNIIVEKKVKSDPDSESSVTTKYDSEGNLVSTYFEDYPDGKNGQKQYRKYDANGCLICDGYSDGNNNGTRNTYYTPSGIKKQETISTDDDKTRYITDYDTSGNKTSERQQKLKSSGSSYINVKGCHLDPTSGRVINEYSPYKDYGVCVDKIYTNYNEDGSKTVELKRDYGYKEETYLITKYDKDGNITENRSDPTRLWYYGTQTVLNADGSKSVIKSHDAGQGTNPPLSITTYDKDGNMTKSQTLTADGKIYEQIYQNGKVIKSCYTDNFE